MAGIPTVTEATFEREVLASELPVLIDLYADWCQPCKVLGPRVAEVAREYEGRLKVVQIDVDRSPRIAAMFRAQSIPMLVLIAQGRPVGVLHGAVPKQQIVDLITPHLAGAADEVNPDELAKLLKTRQVLALDVREAGPFARAHVPGAVNAPVAELATKLPELARLRRPFIVYDRSAGDDAKNALKILQESGVPAGILKGGFLDWEAAGFDIEKSN